MQASDTGANNADPLPAEVYIHVALLLRLERLMDRGSVH